MSAKIVAAATLSSAALTFGAIGIKKLYQQFKADDINAAGLGVFINLRELPQFVVLMFKNKRLRNMMITALLFTVRSIRQLSL